MTAVGGLTRRSQDLLPTLLGESEEAQEDGSKLSLLQIHMSFRGL